MNLDSYLALPYYRLLEQRKRFAGGNFSKETVGVHLCCIALGENDLLIFVMSENPGFLKNIDLTLFRSKTFFEQKSCMKSKISCKKIKNF